jgi:hypothetical protein
MKVVCGVLGGYQVSLPNLVTGVRQRQMQHIIYMLRTASRALGLIGFLIGSGRILLQQARRRETRATPRATTTTSDAPTPTRARWREPPTYSLRGREPV